MFKSIKLTWKWYSLAALLFVNTMDGVDFNILPAAIFCLEELSGKNSTALRSFQNQIWHDTVTLGNLFGAYTWSAPILILPVSLLSEYVGQEWIFLAVKIVEGLCDFFTPMALVSEYHWVYLLRALQGAAGGIIYALGVPLAQKHTFQSHLALCIAITVSSAYRLGTALPNLVSGFLCANDDWSTFFWISGILSFCSCAMWAIIPVKNCAFNRKNLTSKTPRPKFGAALKVTFRNKFIYLLIPAAVFIHICQFVFFTFIPKFYADLFEMPITQNKWLSFAPIGITVVTVALGGLSIDRLHQRFGLNVALKITYTLGCLVPAAILICIIATSSKLSVGLATFFHCFSSIFLPIYLPCLLRGAAALDPKHTQFNCGLVATSGMVGFIVAPYMVELITSGRKAHEWRILLGIMSGLFAISWIAYLLIDFSKGERVSNGVQKLSTVELSDRE